MIEPVEQALHCIETAAVPLCGRQGERRLGAASKFMGLAQRRTSFLSTAQSKQGAAEIEACVRIFRFAFEIIAKPLYRIVETTEIEQRRGTLEGCVGMGGIDPKRSSLARALLMAMLWARR